LFYRQTRERELRLARVEAQLASARLDALVAQIRPHFLFNTLHTIGQLWRSGRHTEADAMLDHLGALFQRVQRSTARTLVSVEEELEMVESYLAIEQARFGDRLRVEISVSSDARACALPPLLLQPLVENAIKHGVSAASTAGRVAVRGRVVDGRLFLEVEDDGPGVQRAAHSRGSGTGLATTRQRLIQQFGADHTLIVRNGQTAGTLVHIELPCTTTDSAETSQLVTHTSEPSRVS
jgi:LytS/YehU family sensor histidine kinase